MGTYKNLGELLIEMTDALQPPERLTVAQAAEKYRQLNNPGSYVGPWKNEVTPYLVEPMECMTSRQFNAMVFAGPAQCGKTELFLNLHTYGVVCDPMDMILYQTSNVMARDFSRRRVDRLHRHSPDVGSRLLPSKDSDNTFDKYYRSGMILTLSWPSIAELSGRPVGRTFLTDYDRMPMNVDGEGSPFDLARKRTTTFGSAAMTVAESSPGFVIEDPRWIRRSPHEAPPTKGVLALYNRGDRRRWYWPCPHCRKWFEPAFELLKWPESQDVMECAEKVAMMCPHCAALIEPSRKHELNRRGVWLRDGQTIDEDGRVQGSGIRSDIASFWLKGPAAAFASWKDLVSRYLLAEQEWQRTGSQEALKSTVNTDQGEPFYPRGAERERVPDEIKAMAQPLPEKVVPAGVNFLLAAADVQKNQWVVQVFGVGPCGSAPFRLVLIDRFEIRKSNRKDDDGDTLWVKPGSHLEDWDLVTEQVLGRRYAMADGSGELGISFMGCDSGGRAGVTANAYEWFKKLRRFANGEHTRVHLIKGEGRPDAPRTRVGYPDAAKKDSKAPARGDVPVLFLNVNVLKDELNNLIDRAEEDDAPLCWPDWLPDEWFMEMCSERRTTKGWENPRGARNEAWDLATYALGLCRHRKVDRLNWNEPPPWAALGRRNPYFHPAPETIDVREPVVASPAAGQYTGPNLAALAEKLA